MVYQPLAGETLRQLMSDDLGRLYSLAAKLGTFLATLHDQGVHFHSLHSGNVLLMPDNEFALIDVSDMTIYAWPLMCATRIRSFMRLGKYREDMAMLDKAFWHAVMRAYQQTSISAACCVPRILTKVDYLQGLLSIHD